MPRKKYRSRVGRWEGDADDTYVRLFSSLHTADVMRELGGNELKTYLACLSEAHNPDSRRILWQLLTADERLSKSDAQKLMSDYRLFVFPVSHVSIYFSSISAKNRIYTYLRHLEEVGLIEDVSVPPGSTEKERAAELRRRQAAHLPNIYKFSESWRKL